MNTERDPHRGRGGRYRIDDEGSRVPVTQLEPDSSSPNTSSPEAGQAGNPRSGCSHKGRLGGVEVEEEVEPPPAIEPEKPAAEKPKQTKRSK